MVKALIVRCLKQNFGYYFSLPKKLIHIIVFFLREVKLLTYYYIFDTRYLYDSITGKDGGL